MKHSPSKLEQQALDELQKRLTEMQSKFAKQSVTEVGDSAIFVKLEKTQERFKRIHNPDDKDIGHGEFLFLFDITALEEEIYVPLSIASGKKTVGFIYQIEGAAEGEIDSTDISCRGDGISKITLGTLLFVKIPAGHTANFRALVKIWGGISKDYKIVINQISYKLNLSDARYKKLAVEISSKSIKFL